MQADREEHLLVLLHSVEDFAVEVAGALVGLFLTGLALRVGFLLLLVLLVTLLVLTVAARLAWLRFVVLLCRGSKSLLLLKFLQGNQLLIREGFDREF